MNDHLILVDLEDREIGYGEKMEVHEKGLLHRAFSVFLVSRGRVLLQKRNPEKYHSGGLWANACCSHPRKGETLAEAVPRRLKEELGICTEVEEAFSFIYRTEFSNKLCEYELDHVFLGEYEGEVFEDPEEISETSWMEIGELKEKLVTQPETFASWFIIAAPKVIAILESNGKVSC